MACAGLHGTADGNPIAVDSSGNLQATVNGTVAVAISDPVSISGSVDVTGSSVDVGSVSGTVNVNVASTSQPIETTPGNSSSVNQDQKDVDATSGGTEIVAAVASRKGLLLTNMHASSTVYLGFGLGSSLTTLNGLPLGPGATLAPPTTNVQVRGITVSGTVRVAFAEFT